MRAQQDGVQVKGVRAVSDVVDINSSRQLQVLLRQGLQGLQIFGLADISTCERGVLDMKIYYTYL